VVCTCLDNCRGLCAVLRFGGSGFGWDATAGHGCRAARPGFGMRVLNALVIRAGAARRSSGRRIRATSAVVVCFFDCSGFGTRKRGGVRFGVLGMVDGKGSGRSLRGACRRFCGGVGA
jgi:hypothetical protein